MTAADTAVVEAAYEHPYTRHPDPTTTTESVLTEAALGVLTAAGRSPGEVDGLGVSSFTLAPDHTIDLGWRLGLKLRWLMQDPHGGASGINLLQHAVRAVEAGDATCVLLLAGDHLDRASFDELVAGYNRATAESLTPLPHTGPNPLFALLTQEHMAEHGLSVEDYAQVPLAQRRWAARNPGAVYRQPLDLADYLAAPVVAEPLRLLDCVPVVTGADALLVTGGTAGVQVRAIVAAHNDDGQEGSGLRTGLAAHRDRLWNTAGFGPGDVDLACIYDDYPVMVLVQLADLGFVDAGYRQLLHDRLAVQRWPLNPSGGQLSAGQAGAAGGMHGLVEATRQLLGQAGERQVAGARRALVSGYGMVLYRYGGCANATVLEVSR